MTKNINMKTGDALVLIDVQNVFCPGGKLPIEEGDKVVPVINRWVQKALKQQIPVCASRDWHPLEHVSIRLGSAFRERRAVRARNGFDTRLRPGHQISEAHRLA